MGRQTADVPMQGIESQKQKLTITTLQHLAMYSYIIIAINYIYLVQLNSLETLQYYSDFKFHR